MYILGKSLYFRICINSLALYLTEVWLGTWAPWVATTQCHWLHCWQHGSSAAMAKASSTAAAIFAPVPSRRVNIQGWSPGSCPTLLHYTTGLTHLFKIAGSLGFKDYLYTVHLVSAAQVVRNSTKYNRTWDAIVTAGITAYEASSPIPYLKGW